MDAKKASLAKCVQDVLLDLAERQKQKPRGLVRDNWNFCHNPGDHCGFIVKIVKIMIILKIKIIIVTGINEVSSGVI